MSLIEELEEVKDEAFNALGAAVGYAELAGLRYPVKSYQAKVSERLVRGSRLDDAAAYKAAKADGITTLVDLREENPHDCDLGAEQAELKCVSIGVLDNTAPKPEQVEAFLWTLGNAVPGRIYVHCQAGVGRTGVFVACYRIRVQEWTPGQALKEAQMFGLRIPAQEAFILGFK